LGCFRSLPAHTRSQNNLRSILSGSGPSKDTPEGKRRAELRAELDEIRGAQAGGKGARGKIFDEIKNVQEGMRQKVSVLGAMERGKVME
jgi:hypothetical protein